jgi:hypothetical protein
MWPTRQQREASHGPSSPKQRGERTCPATITPDIQPARRLLSTHWQVFSGHHAGPVMTSTGRRPPAQKATVLASDALTTDGRQLQGAMKVVQELRLASPELAQAIAARHNHEPGLGTAFVVDGSPDIVEVVSRITWYRDEEDIRDKLGLTLAVAALSNMTTSLDYGVRHPLAPLPHHDQPSRWGGQEFLFLAWQMHRRGDRPWIDGSRLVSKITFPEDWLPGAEDNGDPTVVLSAQCVHPSLGKGMAAEATIRVGRTKEQASGLVSSLNRMEADSITGPPLFGAWALNASGQRLSFESFWPNLAHIPGFIDDIATWQVQRLELARDALILAGTRCVA